MPSVRRVAPALVARSAVLLLVALPISARAADPRPGPPLTIHRAAGPIVLDGDLSDAGWQGIEEITTWFETRVGDNVEPQVRNGAYLAYDERYFYAGFRFEDRDPKHVRAPLGDHDAVPSTTDYAGVIVDSRNDGKTAQMFLANPRGVQYDAWTSDATGEDNSPDFYWDAVGKITPTGWNLEIRIPFSSLRYANVSEQTWGILLYRNYPRDRRYQFFSARLPRDVNCFICNSSKLSGLANLPHGSHLVVAPYGTATQTGAPSNGLGSSLENEDLDTEVGLDVKWNPLANAAVDATINPDFSQVESDAAQIAANERFALFYPEKRSFFLEGVDLFATPFTAVYTRTITAPSWGGRVTGRMGKTSYTALATHDQGGGVAILPGPQGSDAALQDFESDVGIVRVRRDLGRSFLSAVGTGRWIDGGGYNVVGGPDLQWRPRPSDSFTGQALWSQSLTPNRPDLAAEWNGQTLADHAALLNWSHGTTHVDWFLQGQDLGPEFRADDGFIPQVGYREGYAELGYTVRPTDAFVSRARFFTVNWVDVEPGGDVLSQRVSGGVGLDGRWNSFIRVELNQDQIRVGDQLLGRFRPRLHLDASPGRLFNYFSIDAYVGEEIDFDNAREGTGTTLVGQLTLRPSNHLDLRGDASARWLNVDAGNGDSGRLFLAQVERLRLILSLSARSFVRLIGQYEQTTRDTSLYTFPDVASKEARFGGSALFAYKLNWQTVFFLGYGDNRTFYDVTNQLEKSGRQAFAKVSYAWQR
jgi:hypothetical protein